MSDQQSSYIKQLSDKYSRLESNIYSEAVKHDDMRYPEEAGVNSTDDQAVVDEQDEKVQFLKTHLAKLQPYQWQGSSATVNVKLSQFDAYIEAKRLQSTLIWLKDSTGVFTPHYLIGLASSFDSDYSRLLLVRLLETDNSRLTIKCLELKSEQADYIYDLQDFLFSHRLSDKDFAEVYDDGQLTITADMGLKISCSNTVSSVLNKLHHRSHLQDLSDAIGSNLKRSNNTSRLLNDVFRAKEIEPPSLSNTTWRNYRAEVFVARLMIMHGHNDSVNKSLKQH